MSRRRMYGEDLTLAEWHRNYLPEKYGRVGHRLDMADRDWTEFCHWCKAPLCIWEEVVDRGQDLNDKATTVTRKLAAQAGVSAWMVAPKFSRPPGVQKRLSELHAEARELEAQTVMHYFTARRLHPGRTAFHRLYPDDFAKEILLMHYSHYSVCESAMRHEPVKNMPAVVEALEKSVLCLPPQRRLFSGMAS